MKIDAEKILDDRQKLINELVDYVKSGIESKNSQILNNLYKLSLFMNAFKHQRNVTFQKFLNEEKLQQMSLKNVEIFLSTNLSIEKLEDIKNLITKESKAL